jgi:hypothetical protein
MAAGHGCLADFQGTEISLSLHRILVILAAVTLLNSAWVASSRADSVTLTWTAPGEDSLVGRAARYDLRYSAQVITVETFLQATEAADMPLPAAPGTTQSYVLGGLPSGVICYLAIKTVDQAGNWSAMSNVIARVPQGTVQAPAVSALISPEDGATEVATGPTLAWLASSGATSYRLQVARGPDFRSLVLDQGGIVETSYAVSGLANDSTYYWRVQASGAGGLSAWSSVRSFRTVAETAARSLPGFSFSVPRPNPARDLSRFDCTLPEAAPMRVEIFDLVGRRVRLLADEVFAAGPLELAFDLRDDRGLRLAAGVYLVRAQLGSTAFLRRLVIVP